MREQERLPVEALLNRFYKRKIYPRIDHFRGSYRLGVLLTRVAQLCMEKVEDEAEGIFDRDWDNLIILDACRHDLYEEVNGEAGYRYTLGSSSSEYIRKNFSNGDYRDIVYVSANPHTHESQFENLTGRKPEEVFHEVFHTYETDWDDEEGTVKPAAVVRDAETAAKLFPDKKLIVHFMQPHHPFIGFDLGFKTEGFPQDVYGGEDPENVWTYAERGWIEDQKIWEGYRRNLEVVMEHVRELVEDLEGKTVVTADHGNFVGENGLYAHPEGSKAAIVRKVPWDVVKMNEDT